MQINLSVQKKIAWKTSLSFFFLMFVPRKISASAEPHIYTHPPACKHTDTHTERHYLNSPSKQYQSTQGLLQMNAVKFCPGPAG